MSLPDDLLAWIAKAWALVLVFAVLGLKGVATAIATAVTRAWMLRLAVGMLFRWTRTYTALLDPEEQEIRRADFARDLLWRRYRRLRRRGHQAPEIAMLLLAPALRDFPSDVVEAVTAVFERSQRRVVRLWCRRSPMRKWTDRGRLERALAYLAREHGYYVTTNRDELLCCRTCTWAEVPDDAPGAVLWCIQIDGHSFDGDSGYCDDVYSNWLQHSLHLQWAGNGRLIVKTLRSFGFDVKWNGRRNRAIAVLPSLLHADPECTSADCRPTRPRRHRLPTVVDPPTQCATTGVSVAT
jgi:hypothetical protein